MEEIKRLSSNKPMIRQYDEAQESLKGVREHHATLYNQLKAKNADLTCWLIDRLQESLTVHQDSAMTIAGIGGG